LKTNAPSKTSDAETHGQKCPRCQAPLACLADWIGGGSHYWKLECGICARRYAYDTHRFKLEEL